MRGQFVKWVPACGNSQNFCANGPRTTDIERRVANHPNLFRFYRRTQGGKGFTGHIIPVLMEVAKTAKGKEIIEAELCQFMRRPKADISRE